MNTRNLHFDLIRGLSALGVVASHLRNAMLVDYSESGARNPILALFYFITGLGHQAVIVFFVLSGFFVGGAILGRADSFSWKSYGIARLTRLWVVLVPALLLTAVFDSMTLAGAPKAIHGDWFEMWNSGPASAEAWTITPAVALGNLFFLQTIACPVYGSNSPLWSLANEFWYYVAFPAIWTLFFRASRSSVVEKILCCVGLALLAGLLPLGIWQGFSIWLLGCGACLIPAPRGWMRFASLAGSGFGLLASLGLAKAGKVDGFACDLLVGLFFTGLVVSAKADLRSYGKWLSGIATFLSDISYSMYLVHFPIVVMIAGYAYAGRQLQPDLKGILIFTGWLALLVLASAGFWWGIERQTPKVRRLVEQLLNRPRVLEKEASES